MSVIKQLTKKTSSGTETHDIGAEASNVTMSDGTTVEAAINSHIGSKSNPHGVTKSQIGLGNVPNVATNDQTPTFSQASSRANIASGEKLSTIFGKIMKFFADLKAVAFSGSYTDLVNKPTNMTPTSHASSSTTYGAGNGSSYGHLKLSAETNSTSGVSNGTAATPSAVKAAYDLAASASRTADIVIAAYDAPDNWKAAADYVCDGNSDQTEINAATAALPATGGKIVLSAGTYNISDTITVNRANVTIEGMGMGATNINTASALDGAITLANDKCSLNSFTLKGTSSSSGSGINIPNPYCSVDLIEVSQFYNGINVCSSTSDAEAAHTITRVYAHDCYRPIYICANSCVVQSCRVSDGNVGIWIDGSYNRITDNSINNMSNNGIGFYKNSNAAVNNYVSNITSCGIYLYNSARHNVSKNYIVDCTGSGIATYYASYSDIDGNTCFNSGTGCDLSQSNHINVGHNTFMRGTGQASDYTSSQNTIKIQSNVTYLLCTENFIPGKNYVDASNSSTNIWRNNITA